MLNTSNFANVSCNVDSVNTFPYSTSCTVACTAMSDPPPGGTNLTYTCSAKGDGTVFKPVACIPSMF